MIEAPRARSARAAAAPITSWLSLEPLDTIMVRDGRGADWESAGPGRLAVLPSTVGGAIRSALGRDVGHHIIGPIVRTPAGPIFPAPADIVVHDYDTRRLELVERKDDTEESDLDAAGRFGYRLAGDGDAVGGWISRPGLAAWLAGDTAGWAPGLPVPDALEHWRAADPWRVEPRVGLARKWTGEFVGTVDQGMLYSSSHLRPSDGVTLLAGCVDDKPVEVRDDLVPLGGRGRLAHVTPVDDAPLPPAPQDFPDGRMTVYLATPALLGDVRWTAERATLAALALSGPEAVATASPRRGHHETRRLIWAVPAGTVFYLTFVDSATAKQWSGAHHGHLLPGQLDRPIVNAGFGVCLTGRW